MVFNQFQAALMGGLSPIVPPFKEKIPPPWQKASLDIIDHLSSYQTINTQFWQHYSNEITALAHQPAQLILILLALLVYFHDDLQTLRQNIDYLVKKYSFSSLMQESLYLMAEAIAAGLRRQLNPSSLLFQLSRNHPHYRLSADFALIQASLKEGIAINQVQKKLSHQKNPEVTAICLAFFCFCDTPDLPHLSLLRAKQTPLSELTVRLTGALVGVTGGFSHLPWLWQVNNLKNPQNKLIFSKVNILWQKWLGNLANSSDEQFLTSVATPLVMQPRPSLHLISHKEYLKFPAISDQTE